jgi:hypothetical protein
MAASSGKSRIAFDMRCGRNNAIDQVKQAWSDADTAYAPDRDRSKQREHPSHHKKKFHAILPVNKRRIGDRGVGFRAVQRLLSSDCQDRLCLDARLAALAPTVPSLSPPLKIRFTL